MYLVDTSVWVDYLRGKTTPQVRTLILLHDDRDFESIAAVIADLRLFAVQ